MLPFLLAIVLQADTVDRADALRAEARRIERVYEWRVRSLAPFSRRGGSGGECHERVGRFCLWFDDEDDDEPEVIPAEPEAVVAARRAAVQALRRAFSAAPDDPGVVGALVRYLVEDGRAEEAASAARTLVSLRADTALAHALLGFALHHAGDPAEAEAAFGAALERMDENERRRHEDLSELLDGEARTTYGGLRGEARTRFERRLWRLAQPLWLETGNPTRTEHLSRHVWVRLLPEAPWVRGKIGWGRDLEELTLRYGMPVSRERIPGRSLDGFGLIERYDPAQVTLLGASVDSAAPGGRDPLDPPRPKSAHLPGTLRSLVTIPHQLARFPAAVGAVDVRAYGALALDTLVDGARWQAALLARDAETLDPVSDVPATVRVVGDSAYVEGRLMLPPGDFIYSLELLDEGSRLAGRARRPLTIEPPSSVCIPDVVVTRAFEEGAPLPATRDDVALRPLAALVVSPGETLGLFADVSGCLATGRAAGAARVELAIERVDRPAAVVRAVRWIGRRLGLSEEVAEPRLAWTRAIGRSPAEAAAPIAVNLALGALDEGLYAVVLRVRAEAWSEEARARLRVAR